ncbi:hypothetical protein GGR56DRAFT_663529 [Xylariaceae sp. FL0804]|nr:hypothetical protein GGR56DRAFT_663529 [Xylariaceae sp. FL0804]
MTLPRAFARANGLPLLQATRQPTAGARSRPASSWPTGASSRRGFEPSTRRYDFPSVRPRRHYSSQAPSTTSPLGRTALYDVHREHGAKMVPFGGFEMPVQYAGQSVSESHHFTRRRASLFDVGHMVQHRLRGPGAEAFLQRVTPSSLAGLAPGQGTLSVLLWPATGGIVDDLVITREGPESFYLVTNAGCRDKDLAYLAAELDKWRAGGGGGGEVQHEVLEGWGLVALQGPLAEEILTEVFDVGGPADGGPPADRPFTFGQTRRASLRGGEQGEHAVEVSIARAGYTGEDGFELSIPPAHTVRVARALLDNAGPDRLRLAGLGARDSLRLEAGMCLYGHDLDDTTTPVEGGLAWTIGRDRRGGDHNSSFHGADVVLAQLKPRSKGGPDKRRRVGLVVEGGRPAREGAEVLDGSDEAAVVVGVVTSGCPSPTLGRNIAMAYVPDGRHQEGTRLLVRTPGRKDARPAVVTKMPFVPTKYKKA